MIIKGKTLFADGFNDAIIGTTDDGRVVYSKVYMIEVLVTDSDMSVDDAIEFLESNTWIAYVGDFTPLYVNDFAAAEDEVKTYINAYCTK